MPPVCRLVSEPVDGERRKVDSGIFTKHQLAYDADMMGCRIDKVLPFRLEDSNTLTQVDAGLQ